MLKLRAGRLSAASPLLRIIAPIYRFAAASDLPFCSCHSIIQDVCWKHCSACERTYIGDMQRSTPCRWRRLMSAHEKMHFVEASCRMTEIIAKGGDASEEKSILLYITKHENFQYWEQVHQRIAGREQRVFFQKTHRVCLLERQSTGTLKFLPLPSMRL